jgi:hypothetical protein
VKTMLVSLIAPRTRCCTNKFIIVSNEIVDNFFSLWGPKSRYQYEEK